MDINDTDDVNDARYQAVVRWFNPDKGYGFADNDEFGEVFIHYTSIEMNGYREVDEGDIIEFRRAVTDKGFAAELITIVKKAEKEVPCVESSKVGNKLRFVVPTGSPVRAAAVIKQHYQDEGELEVLIDQLLVAEL